MAADFKTQFESSRPDTAEGHQVKLMAFFVVKKLRYRIPACVGRVAGSNPAFPTLQKVIR